MSIIGFIHYSAGSSGISATGFWITLGVAGFIAIVWFFFGGK
jgi:hypothetical protein